MDIVDFYGKDNYDLHQIGAYSALYAPTLSKLLLPGYFHDGEIRTAGIA
jgi:hypothetical protein